MSPAEAKKTENSREAEQWRSRKAKRQKSREKKISKQAKSRNSEQRRSREQRNRKKKQKNMDTEIPPKNAQNGKQLMLKRENTYCFFFKSSLMKFGRDLGTSLGIRVLAIVVVAAFLVVDLALLHLTHEQLST
jgi:Flp pilus assembly protein TadB